MSGFSKGLIQTLIEMKVINKSTIVQARYKSKSGLFAGYSIKTGLFYVDDIKRNNDGDIIFYLWREIDGFRINVSGEDIEKIDGMVPDLLASAYDILPDGNKIVHEKKRGRPRIHPVEEYVPENIKSYSKRIRKETIVFDD